MEDHFLFQQDNAPKDKASSISKWSGVTERPAQSSDLNPIQRRDELERSRPNLPTAVIELMNALVAEWDQVPAAFNILGKVFRKELEDVVAEY